LHLCRFTLFISVDCKNHWYLFPPVVPLLFCLFLFFLLLSLYLFVIIFIPFEPSSLYIDHIPIYLSLIVPKTEITVDGKGKSSFRTFTDKKFLIWYIVFRVMIGLVLLKLMMLIVKLDYFCVVWELCWISIFLLEISQGILHPNAHGCLEVWSMQPIWRHLCSRPHVKLRHRMIFWSMNITKMCSLLQFV